MASDGGPELAAAWFRVSAGHQVSANQVPDVEQFAARRGYQLAGRYTVSDTAWKNGGGPEYRQTLKQALDDAHAGKFSVLIVWALDRIVRDDEGGAEAARRGGAGRRARVGGGGGRGGVGRARRADQGRPGHAPRAGPARRPAGRREGRPPPAARWGRRGAGKA